MATNFTYINAALVRSGNETITALDEGTTAANVASANYEVMVREELCRRWKFATRVNILNRLVDEAPLPWSAAYQLPTGLIALRSVSVGGLRIPFARMADAIMCNASESDEVAALNVWRVPETLWPSDFAGAMTTRLEAMFLRSIGERHAEASPRDREADKLFQTARTQDSQSQSPVDPWSYPILEARSA